LDSVNAEPPQPDAGQGWRLSLFWGLVLGIAAEIPALFLAMTSGGAGHGDYGFARALFPVPMLTTLLEGDTIGPISFGLALVQFPLFGALIGWSKAKAQWKPLLAMLCFYAVAVIAAFSGTIPNFS
jgi:hypothetical protein